MNNELQTMRLFSPLFPHIYRKDEWGDFENDPEDLTSGEVLEYEDEILALIWKEKLPSEGERLLAVYLDGNLPKRCKASIRVLRNGTVNCGDLCLDDGAKRYSGD